MGGQFSLIHWLVVILILMLLFGPSKIESLGRSLGRAIRGFKEGMNEIDATAQDVTSNPKPEEKPQALSAQSSQNSNMNQAVEKKEKT